MCVKQLRSSPKQIVSNPTCVGRAARRKREQQVIRGRTPSPARPTPSSITAAEVAAIFANSQALPAQPADNSRRSRPLALDHGPAGLETQSRAGAVELLDELEQLHVDLDLLERAVAEVVRSLRGAGATWDDLGAAVGISRQAARSRWHRLMR